MLIYTTRWYTIQDLITKFALLVEYNSKIVMDKVVTEKPVGKHRIPYASMCGWIGLMSICI